MGVWKTCGKYAEMETIECALLFFLIWSGRLSENNLADFLHVLPVSVFPLNSLRLQGLGGVGGGEWQLPNLGAEWTSRKRCLAADWWVVPWARFIKIGKNKVAGAFQCRIVPLSEDTPCQSPWRFQSYKGLKKWCPGSMLESF